MMYTSLVVSGVILTMVFGDLIFRSFEKDQWNNGICKESGLKWELFDTDSQGGRMYRDGTGNYCDISYGVDNEEVAS